MQISHEVPFALLESSREFNDYDYALVHLFEEHSDYYEFYKESLNLGRKVILDNSVFELETAFDSKRFAYWVDQLKPTEYIIPDVLDDSLATMKSTIDWVREYGKQLSFSKSIGVIQGQTLNDALQCYRAISPIVDKVAVSFNCKFYEDMFPNLPKLESWMKGRQKFMDILSEYEYFNRGQPFHLLGCALPKEFLHYQKPSFSFIDTVDTSNPIVHAIHNISYTPTGLDDKISTKMIEYLHYTDFNMDLINHNVGIFRKLVNG